MLQTCAVSFRVFTDDGLPDIGASVSATLNQFEVYDGYVVPELVAGKTDSNGFVILRLWPNELGSTGSMYTVKIVSTNGKKLTVSAVVPNLASANIEDIAQMPAYPGKTDADASMTIAVTAATSAQTSSISAQTSATSAAASALLAVNSTPSQAAISAGNSATSAAGSATTASTQAANAATSATSAATQSSASQVSATNSANSATASANSATAAAGSATAAQNSASSIGNAQTASANSATAAALSATAAQTSATAASVSNNAAANSATSAASSATDALASKNAAATSATGAADSLTAAQTSATNAATSASTATNKANDAATSATNSATSATAALASQNAAASSATGAQASAATATTQAAGALASANTASAQAGAAATSATNAANSATAAGNSATAAAGSVTTVQASAANAASSATAASTSATAAQTSATNSANSATASQNSANSITGSVTAAQTSATNAANSATAAAASASSVQASANTASTQASNAAASAAQAASSASTAVSGGIRYDTAQSLDSTQTAQARSNIGLGTIATQAANSVAITGGAISGTSITVKDNVFTLQDDADPTKQAQFQLSGLATGTMYTYTLPNNVATTLAGLGVNQTFTNTNTFSATTLNFGSSTAASTQQFAYGATTTGLTKTVNVGTGGLSGSTTNITVGSANGSTTTMLGSTVIGGVAGNQSLQVNNVAGAVDYLQVLGNSGGFPSLSAQGASTNVSIVYGTKGTGGHNFTTGGLSVNQFVIAHTASAVNYAQVSGVVTGSPVIFSAQGSDTNVSLAYAPKGTGRHTFYSNSGTQFVVGNTASAVNYAQTDGAATGAAPTISAQGSDTNIGLVLQGKGTGVVALGGSTVANSSLVANPTASSANYVQVTGGAGTTWPSISSLGTAATSGFFFNAKSAGYSFAVNGAANASISYTASAVNYLQLAGAVTTGAPELSAQGSDANIDLLLRPKGTGVVALGGSTVANSGFVVSPVTSSVNYVQAYGAATGAGPSIFAAGADANVSLVIQPKGAGRIFFYGNNGYQAQIISAASSVNYLALTGAATGSPPTLSATGSDVNVDLKLIPKGAGVVTVTSDAVINGMTVGIGGGSLAQNAAFGGVTLPFNTTGNFNVAVGYQSMFWNKTGSSNVGLGFATLFLNTTANQNLAMGVSALTVLTTSVATLGAITAGSGYTNGTYTAVAMTPVSGATFVTYPTVTVVVSGGVVSSVTLVTSGQGASSAAATVLTVAAALIGGTGSGFSIAVGSFVAGGNNTAIGYQAGSTLATGSNNTLIGYQAAASSTTVSNEVTLGNSSVTAFRIPGLSITGAASALTIGSQFAVTNTASAVNYAQVTGAAANGAPTLSAQGSDANINFIYDAKGTGYHFFRSQNGLIQMAVASTAASQNYLLVSGAAQYNSVPLTLSGVDTNIGMVISSKGNSGIGLFTSQFSSQAVNISHTAAAVNCLNFTGATTTNNPAISSIGSDADVGLNFYMKGWSAIKFISSTGGQLFQIGQLTSATANYFQALGNSTGNAPVFSAQGTDANVGLVLTGKGTGVVALGGSTVANSGFNVLPVTSSVNYLQATGAAAGNAVYLSAQGADTNIPVVFQTKGTSPLYFAVNNTIQFALLNTTLAVNYAHTRGGIAGSAPVIAVQGSDTDIGLAITSKGFGVVSVNTGTGTVAQFQDRGTATITSPFIFRAGTTGVYSGVFTLPVSANIQVPDASIIFRTQSGASGALGGSIQFTINNASAAVNWLQVAGSATTLAPELSAQGSDTNINLKLTPKGTGGVQFTGPLLPGGASGTAGQVLTSQGASAPIWATPPSGTAISNGTSSVAIGTSNGSVSVSVGGVADVISAASTGAAITSLGVGTAATGTAGEIRATNNITAYYSSDRSLKENIQTIPDALSKVDAIGGKTFDWTDEYIDKQGGEDGYFIRKSDFGVIAQDVDSVFPEAVRTRTDGTLAVDYEKLVALAFAAIVELRAEVKSLRGE